MTPITIKNYKPLEICFPVFTFAFVASKSVQNFQLKLSTCEINFSAQSKLNTKLPQNKALWKTFALIEKKNTALFLKILLFKKHLPAVERDSKME